MKAVAHWFLLVVVHTFTLGAAFHWSAEPFSESSLSFFMKGKIPPQLSLTIEKTLPKSPDLTHCLFATAAPTYRRYSTFSLSLSHWAVPGTAGSMPSDEGFSART